MHNSYVNSLCWGDKRTESRKICIFQPKSFFLEAVLAKWLIWITSKKSQVPITQLIWWPRVSMIGCPVVPSDLCTCVTAMKFHLAACTCLNVWGQTRPQPKARFPALINFVDSRTYTDTTWPRTMKFNTVTRVGRHFSRESGTPPT